MEKKLDVEEFVKDLLKNPSKDLNCIFKISIFRDAVPDAFYVIVFGRYQHHAFCDRFRVHVRADGMHFEVHCHRFALDAVQKMRMLIEQLVNAPKSILGVRWQKKQM